MTSDDHNEEGVKALHRMIAYLRDEAVRLQVMDVAMLLDSAEDAVVAFTPILPGEQGAVGFQRPRTADEH